MGGEARRIQNGLGELEPGTPSAVRQVIDPTGSFSVQQLPDLLRQVAGIYTKQGLRYGTDI
jgi:hypothetical protein